MKITFFSFLIFFSGFVIAQTAPKCDWEGGVPEGCTSVTVGKSASFDGSVMTSHTDDSHRTRSWMDIQAAKQNKAADRMTMYKRVPSDSLAMPSYAHHPIGSIPQVENTFQYVNTAYASMNEHQLAVGESTFGGRDELQSDEGLIDCQRLCIIMLERCTTARQAITLSGELLKEYGWNDYGECLTIADPQEVWHLEIVGPGKGKVGAVWVAQRVPNEHISVNANASTIKEIDISNPDYFMASENIFIVAGENGYWDPSKGNFQFNYAYAPKSRHSLASRRREWRTFDLLAPSLKLDPNGQDFPFSIKPDTLVSLDDMVMVFKDYYENTPFDMTKNMTVANDSGQMVISPLANPFMPYDANKLHKVNGGWGWLGERTIARWYTMYGTIIQCRSWLPDMIGGVEWLALDNIASSIYIPVYAGTTDLPESYKTPGRPNGYTHESAWWAFNRMGTLTSQRWGDMRHDVDAVWLPMQEELFSNQAAFEKEALGLYNISPEKCSKHLTNYTIEWGNKVVDEAWKLGDDLWTKYDEKF
ncbi:MAG: peptidase C69 [Bacteroidales bacterium]|nr:peptidase C69 [Bacteroidales bacterium]